MREEYYAKSKQKNGRQPTNREHLAAVSALAREFAGEFGCRKEGELAGQLHDFGKYSEAFQRVLKGEEGNIDHAICGAAMLRSAAKKHRAYRPILEAINGHHNGLLDYAILDNLLESILTAEAPHVGNAGKLVALWGREQYQKAMACFQRDFPDFRLPGLGKDLPEEETAGMLRTRMLFSCLVDADYSISAQDEDPDYLARTRESLDPDRALAALADHREKIRRESQAAGRVNDIREALFARCGEMAAEEGGLFTLTAPTGTGKTLALLHFALRHCQVWGKKRIIVVLPFLTLADQTTETYQKIFPHVLVDHSQSNLSDEQRDFAQRWSAPVIITTSVKFFESLFAHRPTDCRKLHHLANSVVLFDEAQSLPPEVTGATLKAVGELCRRYRCTMVFSTATQPEFQEVDPAWAPQEIFPQHPAAYDTLRRVEVAWQLEEPTSLEHLAAEMAKEESVCAIVNLRRHARKLFQALKERVSDSDSLFFLTTDLCPAHRKEVLEKIHQHQKDGLPCRVVASQCIEAGVDLDFDVLYRALAPLDAITQAAGRCNRNGRLPEGGQVTVFLPDEEGTLYPDTWYHNAAEVVKRLACHHPIDINDPDHIREYYSALFQNHRDSPELEKAIRDGNYEETDHHYQIIKNRGVSVLVPYEGWGQEFQRIREQALSQGVTKRLLKEAAPLMVATFQKDIELYAERLHFPVGGHSHGEPSEYFVLRGQHEGLYEAVCGLQFPENRKINAIF